MYEIPVLRRRSPGGAEGTERLRPPGRHGPARPGGGASAPAKTIHLSFQKPHRLSRKDFRILIKLLSGVKCHDWDILVYLFRDILHGFLSFTEAQADTALAPYELADCLAQQIAVPSLRKEYGAAEIGDCCVAIVFLQVPDILLWCC